jgi:hypothetical protein
MQRLKANGRLKLVAVIVQLVLVVALTGRGFKIGIIDDPFKNREEADSPVVRESRS